MKELVIHSTIQHTLLLLIPLIFAAVLRVGKVRGSSIIGGVLAGIVLGPAVFGSISSNLWESMFQGGQQSRQIVEQIERQQQSVLSSVVATGVDEVVLEQLRADQQLELEQAVVAWKTQQWEDQRTLRNYVLVLVIVVLLSGSLRRSVIGKSTTATSLSVGVWAAIVPGGIIATASLYLWGTSVAESLAIGACLAAGPWTLTRWEQRAADGSEDGGAALMLRCGRVAWVVAGAAAIYSAWTVQQAMSLVWILPLLLLPLCWSIPRKQLAWLTWLTDNAAIPSIVATTLVLIHPIEAFSFWPVIVVLLVSGDGRWLGGMFGLTILGGRSSMSTMRLTMPLVDAGVSQLCMASLLFGVGVLRPELTLAAIIGVVFLELSAPMRRKFAISIARAA